MISLDNLKTTLNAIKCLLNDYAKKKDVPTKLPNPKHLIFTGAVKRSYDGSKDLTVEILSRPDYNQNDSTAPDYIKNRPFYTGDTGIVKIDYKYLPFLPKPDGEFYLTFSSKNSFTLTAQTPEKTWDGTIEYFASDETWTVWDGSRWNSLSSAYNGTEYVLYLRGTGNTVITGSSRTCWKLDGSDIACIGNIETLLDYATVESGQHPTMGEYCYFWMFRDCTSLTRAPALPATTLANLCYSSMFEGCTSLTRAPELPATTLADGCYSSMFEGCTSLTRAPELPATTLADRCYFCMLAYCTSLTHIPELPATALANSCYYEMFEGCTSIKLSTTKTEEYTQEYRIPFSGNGTTEADALGNMFISTGGTFTGTPEVNKTYYLSSDNMIVRGSDIVNLNGYVKNMIDAIETPPGSGSTVELDTTLSEAGKAADAKAVGDTLAGKQNTISDLEAIRTGAAKGATALQSVPSTYRTASEQDTIDSGKVDKVTGKGLSTNDYTDADKAKVDAIEPVTEQTVSGWGFTKNTGTYSKPTGGIPKTDLANDVQASLGKAETALQEHQSLAAYRTAEAQNIIDNSKQPKLIAGENITIAADGKTISATGGSSVPKPLTYDYMPEGYPTKTVQATTLMEEQELAFSDGGGVYICSLAVALEIVEGQTYTVKWDGTEYVCVCVDDGKYTMLGNMSLSGQGADTGEPFLYLNKAFETLDTSASHTISVKTTTEVITPMAEEFIPTMNVSAFTNDAGYLTFATLPKYEGVVE